MAQITARSIVGTDPTGNNIVGAGRTSTFKVVGELVTEMAPSEIPKTLQSGNYNGRNVSRLVSAFGSKAAAMDLNSYDPLALYEELMAGDNTSDAWNNWSAVATEHGTIDSVGSLNHLKHAGTPDIIGHRPTDTASAYVPDVTLGADLAGAQANFLVKGADDMEINQIHNPKSFPQQAGGTAISLSQNPSDTAESLGNWVSPQFGAWLPAI